MESGETLEISQKTKNHFGIIRRGEQRMDDFKKLTEQLLKIYINAESVNDLGIENYFDENISLIGTGKHEFSGICMSF